MTKKKLKIKIGRPARHGGYSLLTRGVLPEKRKYIGHYLSTIREGLIHDLATSEEDLSTAQKILIDRTVTFLGVVRLIEEFAREHGVLDSKGRVTSGLTAYYLSFNRHIKEYLALLGLEKKALEPEQTLADVIREIDAKKKVKCEDEAKQSVESSEGREGDDQGEIEK